MLPLGDVWAGICRAVPGRPWRPDRATLLPLCNLGYARGACGCFPPDEGADAVRFAIRGDDGVRLRLDYVLERDHHPFLNGTVEYSLPEGSFVESTAAPGVACQARAYIQSYLRRKMEASGGRGASQ